MFPKLFLSLLAALPVSVLVKAEAADETAPRKPNIVFILIDDMGWKDMGCSGSRYYETPHIDRLASQGMRCTNAYSAGIVCNPSRGAIYSGKFPARTKLTTPFIGPEGPDDRLHPVSKYQGQNHPHLEAMHRRVLPKDEVIFAQALAEGGYRTGFFGKWHVGECPGYYPDDRGFQVAKGYRTKAAGTSSSGHWMKTFHKYGAIVCHNPHYTHAVGPFSSITIDDRKLIRFYNKGSRHCLLYNLADDSQEQHDLAKKEPAVRQQLEDLLAKMLLEMDAEMPIPNPSYTGQANREGFDLEFSKDIADKERRIFEERLEKISQK